MIFKNIKEYIALNKPLISSGNRQDSSSSSAVSVSSSSLGIVVKKTASGQHCCNFRLLLRYKAAICNILVLGRYTEIPNRYPIFWNTDRGLPTPTSVFTIPKNTEYRHTENTDRKSVRYLPPGTENFITERVICKLNLYIDVYII